MICCLLLLVSLKATAQETRIAPIGTWTPYVSHYAPEEIERKGDMLYVITKGGLFTYDILTEATKSYSPVEGLSDVNPNALYHDTTSGLLFIGFDVTEPVGQGTDKFPAGSAVRFLEISQMHRVTLWGDRRKSTVDQEG